uniref:RNA-directed RNA polymerase C-terminal domain-containing protein n=1 Tax=Riboviria sp. TaxID=2585031 RepID=A0A893A8C4_9VIRU|nr:MAG: hypothetical protein [Riboviria sp.]
MAKATSLDLKPKSNKQTVYIIIRLAKELYMEVSGLPEGFPPLAVYNSFANLIMMYTVCLFDLGLRSSEVAFAMYGDDNLVGTSQPLLRCCDFAPHLKRRFGMTYTHCSKLDVEPFDTFETITYLGRSFQWDKQWKNVCRAPLRKHIIRESLYWIASDREEEIIASCVQAFAIEMTHHGRQVFEDEIHKLRCALSTRYSKSFLSTLEFGDYSTQVRRMYDPQKGDSPIRTWF